MVIFLAGDVQCWRTAVAADRQLLASKLRQMPLDRVVHGQLPLVRKDHNAGGRDRLGHRSDAEEGVFGHHLAGLDVAQADRLVAEHLIVATDNGDRAGDLALVNELLHPYRNV